MQDDCLSCSQNRSAAEAAKMVKANANECFQFVIFLALLWAAVLSSQCSYATIQITASNVRQTIMSNLKVYRIYQWCWLVTLHSLSIGT